MASSNTIEFEMEENKDSQDNEESETSASSSWKLIRLLVAEGLVQEKVGQIMEEVAEENINELINQGSLQVYDDHPYTGTKLQNSVFISSRILSSPTRILRFYEYPPLALLLAG
ncbi:hypothetical protein ACFX2C_038977 [Malus domestica]